MQGSNQWSLSGNPGRRFALLSLLAVFSVVSPGPTRLIADDAKNAWEKGNAAFRQKHFDEAITDFTETIRIDPSLFMAYYGRGNSYLGKGDLDRAMADFSEAIRLKPDAALGYFFRAGVFKRKADFDRAITDYIESIRLGPNIGATYGARGEVYLNKGDLDRALTDFNEAIRLDPNLAEAYSLRGYANGEKGNYDKAIADYTKAIRLNPNDADSWNNLAWLYATCPEGKFRDGPKAVEHAKKACALTKWKDASFFGAFAAACAEAGDFDEAVKWETKYLESKPPKKDADEASQMLGLFKLGKAYRQQKHPQ